MKIKKLLTTTTLFVVGAHTLSMWAQEDVTNTYLTNADFEESTALTTNVRGYGKDMTEGEVYSLQPVDGWTINILKSASDKGFENSAMGGGVFSYGSDNQMKGNNVTAPSTNPEGGETGNCLGFFVIWSNDAYYSQEVTLPAGSYELSIDIYNQSGTSVSYSRTGFFPEEGESFRIKPNPTVGKWNKGTVSFILDKETKGVISLGYQAANVGSDKSPHIYIDNVKLTYTDLLAGYKEKLGEEIEAAKQITTNRANVGTGAFQIPETAVTTLENAINTAESALGATELTEESLTSASTALNTAIEEYKKVELNAPAENTRYNVVLNTEDSEGWNYDNKAITFIAGGRNNAGLYNIQYLVDPNPNYAQAIIFTKAEGANCYTMSIMDVDGNQRYICTGVPYGGNKNQIRTTTTDTDALVVEIRATNVDGNFNIYNTEANNYIGSQDNGVYTVNSHIDFNIAEAVEAEVALNIEAGKYATAMFPFIPELPAGVKAYSCNELNGNILALEEVAEPIANVPYILQNTNATDVAESVSGYGTAKQDAYTSGYLTASYATTGNYATGSYVLQTQNGHQAFYLVVEEAPVPLTQYRASLNVPAAGAKAFFFGGDVTGINGVEGAEGATEVVRFNAAGVQVATPVKGLNIIKMSEGTVKKVMVK